MNKDNDNYRGKEHSKPWKSEGAILHIPTGTVFPNRKAVVQIFGQNKYRKMLKEKNTLLLHYD